MDKGLVDFRGAVQAALPFPGLCYLREGEEPTSSLLSTTVFLLSASLWFAWLHRTKPAFVGKPGLRVT